VEASLHADSSHLVSIELEERHLSQQLGNVRNLYDGLDMKKERDAMIEETDRTTKNAIPKLKSKKKKNKSY
jgi:hypothetical protein